MEKMKEKMSKYLVLQILILVETNPIHLGVFFLFLGRLRLNDQEFTGLRKLVKPKTNSHSAGRGGGSWKRCWGKKRCWLDTPPREGVLPAAGQDPAGTQKNRQKKPKSYWVGFF